MTDEAIEGWAVMLSRDSKRLARLEDRLAVDSGGSGGGSLNQPELASTSYRKPQAGSDDGSDEEANGAADRGGRGGRGRGRGRGRGFGQRGRGGAGQGQDSGSPAAHQKKEQNKGSRANQIGDSNGRRRLLEGVVCLVEDYLRNCVRQGQNSTRIVRPETGDKPSAKFS
ncbi:unnamed protein product [Penicillium pancosmium]